MCLNYQVKKKEKKQKKTNKIFYAMACKMTTYLFLTIRMYIDKLIDFIFNIFYHEHHPIPALELKQKILTESAVSLAKKIRNKELKSETLVRACIQRIQAVNPILNAVTDERYKAALAEAQEIDKQIAAGLSDEEFKKKPFLGVPFTAKESHAVHSCLHTLGVRSRSHVRAHCDAACVAAVKNAGGVCVAVTNVPEINKWQETRNNVFGQTKNPYHTGRTTGGSSGGEAALMAALATPISLCSDIGGSTRMPAFYCGLFGYNPTAGYTSLKGSALRTGDKDETTMASIGFLARHCEDLGPLTKVVLTEKGIELDLDRHVEIKDIKFFYTETAKDIRVSPIYSDLRKVMNKVIQRLTKDAKTTENVPTPFTHEGFAHMFTLWKYEMTKEGENFAKLLTNNAGEAHGLTELAKKLTGHSPYTLAAILKLLDDQVLPLPNKQWAEQLIEQMRNDISSTLGVDGVLLFPSSPIPAPAHRSAYLRPYNFAYWAVWNALRFPAVQVPLGLNSEGLPLGIQVVAAPKNDVLCLTVAKRLEKIFGGYVPPCAIPE